MDQAKGPQTGVTFEALPICLVCIELRRPSCQSFTCIVPGRAEGRRLSETRTASIRWYRGRNRTTWAAAKRCPFDLPIRETDVVGPAYRASSRRDGKDEANSNTKGNILLLLFSRALGFCRGVLEPLLRSCRRSVGGDLAFDNDLSTLRRGPLRELSSIIGMLEGTVKSPLVSTLYEKPFMGNCATSEIRKAIPPRASTRARPSNISFEGAEGAVGRPCGGEGGSGTAAHEGQQLHTASERKGALAWGIKKYTLFNQ